MIRHKEIWSASLKYADEHPSDYINEMYDIVDIEKAFKAGAKWADANPANYEGKAMLHVLEKGVKQGKKEMLDKAYGWINLHIGELSDIYTRSAIRNKFLDDFRKAMEE